MALTRLLCSLGSPSQGLLFLLALCRLRNKSGPQGDAALVGIRFQPSARRGIT
jgi:hypothetical protein